MTPDEFQKLVEWIALHTRTNEEQAGVAAAEIGDIEPPIDSAGNWLIEVAGKKVVSIPL